MGAETRLISVPQGKMTVSGDICDCHDVRIALPSSR